MYNKLGKSRFVIHGSGLEMYIKSSKSRFVIHRSSLEMYNKSSMSRIVIHGNDWEVPSAIKTKPSKINPSIKYPFDLRSPAS